MQLPEALVVRVDRDRCVAEHGLRTGRGDHDEIPVRPLDGIAEVPQRTFLGLVLDFQVGDRGECARIPIDHVLAAVDQTALVKTDKALGHGSRQPGVHREPLPGPVAARADALELSHDRAAVGLLPVPYVLEELLPPEIAAVDAVLGQLALDQHLGGDTGVIGARQPENIASAHPLPAHRDVDLRGLEHVPHVQRASHVGRRDHQREHGSRRGSVSFEQTLADPPLGPRWFNLRGIVGFL